MSSFYSSSKSSKFKIQHFIPRASYSIKLISLWCMMKKNPSSAFHPLHTPPTLVKNSTGQSSTWQTIKLLVLLFIFSDFNQVESSCQHEHIANAWLRKGPHCEQLLDLNPSAPCKIEKVEFGKRVCEFKVWQTIAAGRDPCYCRSRSCASATPSLHLSVRQDTWTDFASIPQKTEVPKIKLMILNCRLHCGVLYSRKMSRSDTTSINKIKIRLKNRSPTHASGEINLPIALGHFDITFVIHLKPIKNL